MRYLRIVPDYLRDEVLESYLLAFGASMEVFFVVPHIREIDRFSVRCSDRAFLRKPLRDSVVSVIVLVAVIGVSVMVLS